MKKVWILLVDITFFTPVGWYCYCPWIITTIL